MSKEIYELAKKTTPEFLRELTSTFRNIQVAFSTDWTKIRVSYGNEEEKATFSGKVRNFLMDKNYLAQA